MNKKIKIYLSSCNDNITQSTCKTPDFMPLDMSLRKQFTQTPDIKTYENAASKWYMKGHKLKSLRVSKKPRINKKFGFTELNCSQATHFSNRPLLVRKKRTVRRGDISIKGISEDLIITPINFSAPRRISSKNLQINPEEIANWMKSL